MCILTIVPESKNTPVYADYTAIAHLWTSYDNLDMFTRLLFYAMYVNLGKFILWWVFSLCER